MVGATDAGVNKSKKSQRGFMVDLITTSVFDHLIILKKDSLLLLSIQFHQQFFNNWQFHVAFITFYYSNPTCTQWYVIYNMIIIYVTHLAVQTNWIPRVSWISQTYGDIYNEYKYYYLLQLKYLMSRMMNMGIIDASSKFESQR